MRQLASFLLLLCPLGAIAQTIESDTTQTIEEVVVNGFRISGNVLASSPVTDTFHMLIWNDLASTIWAMP